MANFPPIAYTPEMYAAAEAALRASRTPGELIQEPTLEEAQALGEAQADVERLDAELEGAQRAYFAGHQPWPGLPKVRRPGVDLAIEDLERQALAARNALIDLSRRVTADGIRRRQELENPTDKGILARILGGKR